MDLTPQQKFEALKLRYEDQTELLKYMKQVEFRLVTGIVTVQLLLAAWATGAEVSSSMAIIIAIVDSVCVVTVGILLLEYKLRRSEVVETIRNIMDAFKFSDEGYYLQGRSINPAPPQLISWTYAYVFLIILVSAVVMLVLFKAGV